MITIPPIALAAPLPQPEAIISSKIGTAEPTPTNNAASIPSKRRTIKPNRAAVAPDAPRDVCARGYLCPDLLIHLKAAERREP
jgi:hypothetical protein